MINAAYPLISLFFFSLLYLTYKKSESRGTDKYTLNFGLFLSGAILSSILVFYTGIHYNKGVSLAGFFGGISASLAVILFLKSLSFHKLNVSTTVINLSFVIPIIFSVILWREIPGMNQVVSIVLVIISIVLIKNG